DGIRGFHVTGVQTCALPISVFADHDVVGGASADVHPQPGAGGGAAVVVTGEWGESGGDAGVDGKDGVVAAALSGKGDGLVDGRGIAEPDVVGVGRTGGRVASADGRTCRVHHGGAWIPHHCCVTDEIVEWRTCGYHGGIGVHAPPTRCIIES